MCHFITLVVGGSDAATIDQVLRRHGRQAKPVKNISVSRRLAPDEAQYLTTMGHCDCGTVLASSAVDRNDSRAVELAKLTKKGWSKLKIDRWLRDRAKAVELADARRHATTPDTLELWCDAIAGLLAVPGVKQAGLRLHFYSGGVEEEVIEFVRESVPVHAFKSRLMDMGDDRLLMAS